MPFPRRGRASALAASSRPTVGLLVAGVVGLAFGGLGWTWPAGDRTATWSAATTPTAQLDRAAWLPHRAALLDPRTRLPQTHTLPIAGLRAVLAGHHDGGDHPALRKLATWVGHRGGADLPADFFAEPPFMHPSGRSYAALAGHPTHRHVTEAPPSGPLGSTSDTTRLALVQGHTRIVGPRWVLLPAGPDTLAAVPRAAFDRRLAQSGLRYVACTAPSALCLERTPRPWVPGLTALGALLVVAGSALQLRQSRTARRQAVTDQAFVLRTLTHELRTPATAIGLEVDRLRRSFDHLPDDGQDAFLGLATAHRRLRRTLTATAEFLAVAHGRVPLAPVEVRLSTVLADLRLADTEVDGDATVRTDPRWLAIALRNLLANAHQHGVAPVRVRVTPTTDGARVEVADAGTLHASLDTLSRPFQRHPTQRGLGLGLALTRRIAALLGDGLTLHLAPTRFVLHLRDLDPRDPP